MAIVARRRHGEWLKPYMRARPSEMLQRRSLMAALRAAGGVERLLD
jgi:hypothetical protein